jgi:hypothetical protein
MSESKFLTTGTPGKTPIQKTQKTQPSPKASKAKSNGRHSDSPKIEELPGAEAHASKANEEKPVAPDLSAALDDGPSVTRSTPYPDIEAALGLGDDGFTVAEVLTTIVCRKPKPTEFFRVHPSPAMARPAYVFTDREDIGAPTFFVMPEARPYIADHLRPVLLVVCTNRQATPFLWPIAIPDPNTNNGRQNKWGSSALEAMETAKKKWTKITAGPGYYRIFVAENDQLPEPVWLEGKSFGEIVGIAFKEDLIDGPSHPVVQRLRGQR